MPLETVGSDEAILQLIFAYVGHDHEKYVDTRFIWREIALYSKAGGKFHFYRLSQYDPEDPDSEFLSDIGALIRSGRLEVRSDGKVKLAAFGYCFAFAKTVPDSLKSLEEKIGKGEYTK